MAGSTLLITGEIIKSGGMGIGFIGGVQKEV